MTEDFTLRMETLPPPGLASATEPLAGEVVEDEEALEQDAVDDMEDETAEEDDVEEDVDEGAETGA